jgi:hypothetical protein
MAIQSVSMIIRKKNTKGTEREPVRHRLTLCVINKGGVLEAFLLDSNGTVERRNKGDWASRLRDTMQVFLTEELQFPIEVHGIATPNVNFTPDEPTKNLLSELGINDVSTDRGLCRHFTFIFLVELLCTSLHGTTAPHMERFLLLDLLRRADFDSEEKKKLTTREKAEFILYVRALVLGIVNALYPDVDVATVDVYRYRDDDDKPRLERIRS